MTGPPDIESFSNQLRSSDPDRYLTARFAPEESRAALITLFVFHSELARICDSVTEPALGEIRLQWWRDALARSDQADKTGAPLADSLAQVVTEYDLPKSLLLGMIDARSADIDGGGFSDMQALKAYLYKSEGALFALSGQVLGRNDGWNGKVTNSAGLAYGITRLLRYLPRDAAAGRVMLPLTMLEDHGIIPEQLLAGEGGDEFADLFDELAAEARSALAEARHNLAGKPVPTRRIFALLALVEPYLRAMERPQHRRLHEVADINPLRRFVTLWWATRVGKF